MSVLFLLSLVAVSVAHRGRQGRSNLRVKSGDPMDDLPFCIFNERGNFGGNVQVFVQHDNVRALQFSGDGVGTQTMVKCNGDVPQNCGMPRLEAKNINDTQACDMLECPCEPDTTSLQFSYMENMMQEVTPMCELAAVDSLRAADAGPFHILLIGLGGGALPEYTMQHCPKGTKMESVEFDPRVIDAATGFFGLHLHQGVNSVEQGDGGEAVAKRVQNGDKYDVVMVDAFQSAGKVPDSCKNKKFIKNVKALLRPQGKLIQQIWSPQYEDVIQDYQKIFGEDKVKGTNIELGVNHLIIATKEDSS